MLKLMYITNDPAVSEIAADAGVDRIFIDMEVLGKAERQGGMDTVQSTIHRRILQKSVPPSAIRPRSWRASIR